MILTASKLKQIGEALEGPFWGKRLAKRWGVSERMLIRYRSGKSKVPRRRRPKLAELCRQHAAELLRLADELEA